MYAVKSAHYTLLMCNQISSLTLNIIRMKKHHDYFISYLLIYLDCIIVLKSLFWTNHTSPALHLVHILIIGSIPEPPYTFKNAR